tara:strand:+ start:175 stop:792 length:618 start_codon:yes stop_codon:yes gene_type:complete
MDEAVREVAIQLKAWYITLRRSKDEKDYVPPKRWDSVWHEVAKRDPFVHPGKFMQAQFANVRPFPYPTDISSPKAVRIYNDYEDKALDYQDLALSLQANKVKDRMRFETIYELLLDRDEELSALFRVCVASAKNYEDIVDEFMNEAVEQYLHNQAVYEVVYKDIIVPDVTRKAERKFLIAKSLAINSYMPLDEDYNTEYCDDDAF